MPGLGGTPRRRSRGLRATPDPGTSPPACRCRRRSTSGRRGSQAADRRDTAPRRRALSDCRGRTDRRARVGSAASSCVASARAYTRVDESSRNESNCNSARQRATSPTCASCSVQRARAEIAGQAGTIDDMTGGSASCQQCWQRGTCDGVHHLVLAFQPGDQRRTDEAAGADDGEGRNVVRHRDEHRSV